MRRWRRGNDVRRFCLVLVVCAATDTPWFGLQAIQERCQELPLAFSELDFVQSPAQTRHVDPQLIIRHPAGVPTVPFCRCCCWPLGLLLWPALGTKPASSTQSLARAIAFCGDWSYEQACPVPFGQLERSRDVPSRNFPVQRRVSAFPHAAPHHRWHNSIWNVIALISMADDAPWPQALM